MPRIPILFAGTALFVLSVGLLSSRFNFSAGMTLTLLKKTYLIPYHLLCFGAASCLCIFAFLYSMWMVHWNARVALWHLGLSVVSLTLFFGAAVAAQRVKLTDGSSPLAVTVLLAFIVSPLLFLLTQGLFALDGLRRCLPLFRG